MNNFASGLQEMNIFVVHFQRIANYLTKIQMNKFIFIIILLYIYSFVILIKQIIFSSCTGNNNQNIMKEFLSKPLLELTNHRTLNRSISSSAIQKLHQKLHQVKKTNELHFCDARMLSRDLITKQREQKNFKLPMKIIKKMIIFERYAKCFLIIYWSNSSVSRQLNF